MPYDANIPVETNLVRTTSGDLALMRANFQALSGVATLGMNGISGLDTDLRVAGDFAHVHAAGSSWRISSMTGLVSGGGARWNGTTWVPSGYALDDLTDVSTSGAVSGQALVFNGSVWAPGNVAAEGTTGGVSGFVLRSWAKMALSGNRFIVNNVLTTVTGFNFDTQAISGAGGAPVFTVSAASGQIVVPSGIDLVKVYAQTTWVASGATVGKTTQIRLNGAPLASFETQAAAFHVGTGAASGTSMLAATPMVSVVSGDTFTIAVQTTSDADVASGSTWLYVEGYTASGTGGGGNGGQFYQAQLRLPSGVNQTITNNSNNTVTGMEIKQQVGTFAINAASGVIEIPSGVTHFQVFGQIRYEAAATGDRRATILFNGLEAVSGGGLGFNSTQAVGNAASPHVVFVETPLLEAVAGMPISLRARQGSGGDLDVEWGFAIASGAVHQTFLSVRCFDLVDAA